MCENEKTIDKIRKLMNLGNKTMYKGEAEQAMAAAMRLAAKIGVSLEDIKAEEKDSVIGEFPVYKRKASFALWERRLALGIAHALGCELVTVKYYRQCFFEIIGTREDAELFDVLHDLIRGQLQKMWKQYKADNVWRWSYNTDYYKKPWYLGAASRIRERAMEIFQSTATEEERNQYALVVQNKLVVRKGWMADNLHTHQGRRSSFSYSSSAYGSGYESAGRVSFASNRLGA